MTLRVLLFSPLRGRDPESGDIAYTEALLADPPPGVTYTTYAEALDAGLMRIRGGRPRRGDAALLDLAFMVVRVGELLLRKAGMMFREPTWYVTIDPSAFDAVHQHLFAVRQIGSHVPVVSSAGYPLPILYGAREKWSSRRLGLATALERAYARVMNVHNPWLRCAPGNLMTVYSERFRGYLISMGARPEQVSVCSNAVADVECPPRRSDGLTLGFIGRDFDLKGGDIALGAFKQLRGRHPGLRLRIVTTSESAASHDLQGEGIEVYTDVAHAGVLLEQLPEIDILLLPTRSDCGAPYSLLEALRGGTCAITSQHPWLDERLEPPGVTRVAADVDAVAGALERLLQPDELSAAQQAARRLCSEEFSTPVIHARLLEACRRVSAGDP